jgi:hypothetical protein
MGRWRGFRGMAVLGAVVVACGEAPEPTAVDTAAAGSAAAGVEAGLGRLAGGGALVYVVHGINGEDLGLAAALPVDVSVDGGCVLRGFEFRGIAGPLFLRAGVYDVRVRLADAASPCSGALAVDAPGVPVGAGESVSLVAHLAADGTPTASKFVNDVARRPGRSRVVARHVAAFGAVDIVVDGAVALARVENGGEGAADLRPGRHSLGIAAAGTGVFAFRRDLVLLPLNVYIAYAVGTPANGTFEVLLQRLAQF